MNIQYVKDTPDIVRSEGEIDLSNAEQLGSALDTAIRNSPQGFIVDLSRVTYLDSAGVATILAAYRRVRTAGGRLAIVLMNRNIRDILLLIHVERLPDLLLCENVVEARNALSRPEANHDPA